MGERSIVKYSFLVRLIWRLLIRPLAVAAANDDEDDLFTMETVEALDSIINLDFTQIT